MFEGHVRGLSSRRAPPKSQTSRGDHGEVGSLACCGMRLPVFACASASRSNAHAETEGRSMRQRMRAAEQRAIARRHRTPQRFLAVMAAPAQPDRADPHPPRPAFPQRNQPKHGEIGGITANLLANPCSARICVRAQRARRRARGSACPPNQGRIRRVADGFATHLIRVRASTTAPCPPIQSR